MVKKYLYTDLDLAFTLHPSRKDLILSVDENAIKRSVRNLVLTNHYERPFHPEIGSNVRKMLFEPITAVTQNHLRREIYDVIKNFEPRVNIIDVVVEVNNDYQSLIATISFYIINSTVPTTIDILLERLR